MRPTLRELLLGPSLVERADAAPATEALADALDAELRAVLALLPQVYDGTTDSCLQAILEFERILALPRDADGVVCRRAALLFALAREPEIAARFDEPLARDLHERVLPLLLPRFLRHSCQAPDAFVAGALVLAELWPAERVGNWPRAE